MPSEPARLHTYAVSPRILVEAPDPHTAIRLVEWVLIGESKGAVHVYAHGGATITGFDGTTIEILSADDPTYDAEDITALERACAEGMHDREEAAMSVDIPAPTRDYPNLYQIGPQTYTILSIPKEGEMKPGTVPTPVTAPNPVDAIMQLCADIIPSGGGVEYTEWLREVNAALIHLATRVPTAAEVAAIGRIDSYMATFANFDDYAAIHADVETVCLLANRSQP